MGRIGGGELLLILLIALLIFGPSKLADMGKGLGQGLKNFKKGMSHDGDDDDGKTVVEHAPSSPEAPKALPAGPTHGAKVASSTGEAPPSDEPKAVADARK